MRKKIITSTAALLVLAVLGVGVWMTQSEHRPTTPQRPVSAPVQTASKPQVAGANTKTPSTNLPKDRPINLVVSDGRQTKVISSTQPGTAVEPPDGTLPQQPSPPPSSPSPGTPQAVTINLSGPLTATLSPGQHTPILTYELTDDAQFEWFPGVSTGWIDTPKPPDAPVWSTVLEHRPSQPYIGSYVHFFITANAKARPGVYKVSVKIRLTPQVVLGVPVMVTIPEAPAASHTATTRPG